MSRPVLMVALASIACSPLAAGGQSTFVSAAELGREAAVEEMLRLFEYRENDTAGELGSSLVGRFPDDPTINALSLIAYSRYGGQFEALPLAERNVERWPDDAWTHAALAVALQKPARRQEALQAAGRARVLAPRDAYLLTQLGPVYAGSGAEYIAAIDSFIAEGHATAELRVRRANHMRVIANRATPRDTALHRQAMDEYAAIRADWPMHPGAYWIEGEVLFSERRNEEALMLLERATELAATSGAINHYWRALRVRPGSSPAEGEAQVRAAADAWVEARGGSVGALHVAVMFFGIKDGAHFADRLITSYPNSWHAAQLEYQRAWAMGEAAEELIGPDSITAVQGYREALRRVRRLPGVNANASLGALADLIWSIAPDPATGAEEIWDLHQELEQGLEAVGAGHWNEYVRYTTVPRALAERGARLIQVEALARRGAEIREMILEQSRQTYTVAEYADELDWLQADFRTTLGSIYLARGDLAAARSELEKAYDKIKTDPETAFQLGRVAEAAGEIEDAESWYSVGYGLEQSKFDYRRNHEALRRIFTSRHGSADGFDEYLSAVDEREKARRREKVLADRLEELRALPEFTLEWLNGEGKFDSRGLQGKVTVINFWGVWCPPCVREAPEIQRFSERFRDHPEVVFLTVSNDDNPQLTRDWMKEKGYDFPVLIEETLNRAASVRVYPTTYFIDRAGRISFSAIGASAGLVDEYTWRVETLLQEDASR
jgi:thiol-disulfide isomerase/thioredoxin/Flp pilus assembly protein TadD